MRPVTYLDLVEDYAQREWVRQCQAARRTDDDGLYVIIYLVLTLVVWSFTGLLAWYVW